MTRIPLLDANDEPDELHEVFEQLRATRGQVPSMYRALAHHPQILSAHRAYFDAALDGGYLARGFKELIALRVAVICGSRYSTASHRRYARRHGASEAEVDALQSGDLGVFDERTRAALAFASAAVRDGVDDPTFVEMNRFFGPTEIVELSALIGVMQLASTLGAVFGLQPDGES